MPFYIVWGSESAPFRYFPNTLRDNAGIGVTGKVRPRLGKSLLTAPLNPRGLGMDSKPELQRVLEHRRRNQLIKKKEEELEAKRMQCPFKQELLRRQQRLNQVGGRHPASVCASSKRKVGMGSRTHLCPAA